MDPGEGEGEGRRGKNGASSSSLHPNARQTNGVVINTTEAEGGATATVAKHAHVDVAGNGTSPAGPTASSTPSNKRPRRGASRNGNPTATAAVDDKQAATAAAAAAAGGGQNAATQAAAAAGGGDSEFSPRPTNGLSSSDTER